MKIYLFFTLIILCFFSCQQKDKENESAQELKPIVFGQIDSMYSNILKESREIWIHLPESAKRGNKDKKFPVLYLLDGPGHFYSVAGMIKQLSASNGNTKLPKMIVVAIPNTNRGRDLTPTHAEFDYFTGDSATYDSGGGGKFLDFIEDELIPYIEESYPAASYRTYVGHSFGGLSVINALITKPHLFNNYISIDPSLWWDSLAFRNYAYSILKTENYEDKALYVAIANTMEEGMDIQSVQPDTSKRTAHIRSILQFVQSLESNNTNGLDFKWKYYDEDDHLSVPLIAEYDALRWLFHWHDFKGKNQIYTTASEMTAEELLELPKAHFKEVSKQFGYEVLPPEMLINGIGYFLLNQKMPEKAAAFFDLNIKNYSNSSNVYDSRGDCYLVQEDSVKALEYFKKALELEDLDLYREKTEMLEQSLKN